MRTLVVLSGAGVSAESGLATFRDNDGLWSNYSVYDVATPEAFHRDPEMVLDFYNFRRDEVRKASPNAAHQAIADAEKYFDVKIVTQNVDDLHERAGSACVYHVHGLITQSRSQVSGQTYDLGTGNIAIGDRCEHGAQLRPHVVWFGEVPDHMDTAQQMVEEADIVLVVGTSLSVYPFAGLVEFTKPDAQCFVVTKDIDFAPAGFELIEGLASEEVPRLLSRLHPKQVIW